MSSDKFELSTLPSDVLTFVVKKLSYEDALAVGMTCRGLHSIANSDDVWMELCKPWESEIRLEDWRSQAQSGKALFRLLRTFGNIVGLWSSKDLAPRGALLFVTWGEFSLVASKVTPQSIGSVSFIRLFEVIGCPDGSMKVELVSKISELRLPVAFVWSSPGKVEFHLDVQPENNTTDDEEASEEQSDDEGVESRPTQRNDDLRLRLQQSLLLRGFPLGPDAQRPVMPLPGFDHDQQEWTNIGQRALQYLLRLASFGNRRRSRYGNENTRPGGRAGRYSYQKLNMKSSRERNLAGLWTGIYGPHGLEIIAVSYEDDHIIATKILGDPNVPCNEVTFDVSIASESQDIPLELQRLAAMLVAPGSRRAADIVTVYRGLGRIAGYNFRNPRWVTGQLLVDCYGTMSFLWEKVNFVIQFRRLDLASLYKRELAEKQEDSDPTFGLPGLIVIRNEGSTDNVENRTFYLIN